MASPAQQLFYFSSANRGNAGGSRGRGSIGAMGYNQEFGAPVALPMTVSDNGNFHDITFSEIQIIDILNHFNWTNSRRNNRTGKHVGGGRGGVNPSGDKAGETSFGWTSTGTDNPGSGMQNWSGIPAVMLSEYRPTFNAAMANVKYQLAAAAEGAQIVSEVGAGLISKIAKQAGVGDAVGDAAWVTALGKTAGNLLDTSGKTLGKMNEAAKGGAQFDAALATNGAQMLEKHLKSYAGLYPASPSGFKYVMPYLTSQQLRSATSSWSDAGIDSMKGFLGGIGNVLNMTAGAVHGPTGQMLSKIANFPGKMFDASQGMAKSVAGIFEPNAYIENNKSFNYGAPGKPIQVQFMLSNTNSWQEVIDNWHLCFLLTYQNLPNKTTKVALEPPVIYEVEIPGHYYSPFSHVSNLSITGLGTTRTMSMPLKVAQGGSQMTVQEDADGNPIVQEHSDNHGSKSFPADNAQRTGAQQKNKIEGSEDIYPKFVDALIPEVYVVSLTLQPLLPDSRNFDLQAIRNSGTLFTASVQEAESKTSGDVAVGPDAAADEVLTTNPNSVGVNPNSSDYGKKFK